MAIVSKVRQILDSSCPPSGMNFEAGDVSTVLAGTYLVSLEALRSCTGVCEVCIQRAMLNLPGFGT